MKMVLVLVYLIILLFLISNNFFESNLYNNIPSSLEGGEEIPSKLDKEGDINITNVLEIDNDNGNLLQIKPIYNCNAKKSKNVRDTKFVFVHVFKAGGSTIRQLFRNYAQYCHSGVAIFIKCSNVTAASIDRDDFWYSQRNNSSSEKCIIKDYIHRSGKISHEHMYVKNAFLNEHMDIIAGHVSLGSTYNWKSESNKDSPAKIQYVIFFRESLERLISGMIYLYSPSKSNKALPDTFDTFVSNCKEKIRQKRSLTVYSDVYIRYLITPRQREQSTYAELDINSRTKLAMDNILKLKALVGIVEKMPQSFDMLHHLMDGKNEVKQMFTEFSGIKKNASKNNIRAKSINITTTSVVAEIKKDTEFMGMVTDYLKYDDDMYNFASSLHKEQYSLFQKQTTMFQ